MDLEYIRQLLKIFDDSTATELSVESDGNHIHISRQHPELVSAPMMYSAPALPPVPAPVPVAPIPVSAAPAPAINNEHTVLSPIVGTFYRAPNPGAEPFVQVGSRVSVGDALCIVEAMKLMNSIESDCAGMIMKVLVENGQPVEYNQPLFIIQPD
ncbi:acetyl-CoA carboxylase biotin carboxyl carrier protein [Ignavibacteria bacterium]|nr:acetyl-CoA carboxylase biotin carboxyl carrier protein [Bacteroidota bacterium]